MQSDDPQDTGASPSANKLPQATRGKFFSKDTANYLYEDIPYVRALFGAFDGGIISYSTFKIFFDIACPSKSSASDTMHKSLESPEVAALAALEALTIVSLSFIGNLFDDDDDNKFIAWAAWFWAYFRDGFKGMKFAYRGVQTSFSLLGIGSQAILLSAGLGLGVLAAANRIWYRNYILEPRKKYQKNNNLLLKNAQNLGLKNNYELHEMPEKDAYEPNRVYIKINEKEGCLEYKVYDPFMKLVKGKINLTNELLYRKQYDGNGSPIPLIFDDLKNNYFETILSIVAKSGHIANSNDEEHRHLISAQMGACCSIVITQWPGKEGSNIDIELGPFAAGYVRVISEDPEKNGLFYAQKKQCCSLFMSEVPDRDVSKINLEDFESGYIRVVNEKKKINQLYYIDKKTKLPPLELELNESALANYDKHINCNNTPQILLAKELADITRITNHTHKSTTILTLLEQDKEKLEKYDSQIIDYCDEEEKNDKELLPDQSILQMLNEHQLEDFLNKQKHQAYIDKMKRRCLRITQFNTLQALSLNQSAMIKALTKNDAHKEKQHLPSQIKRMASALIGGFSDSLYTYMGIYALAALSSPLFILAITCSILFSVICIANRCYEEYEYQQNFIRSCLNVEFVLLQKEMEATFAELIQISKDNAQRNELRTNARVEVLCLNLDNLLLKHKAKKKELESIVIFSYPRAFLSGLRSGLYGYSAICSLVSVISVCCVISGAALPPAVLIAGVILGLVALIWFSLSAIRLTHQHMKKMEVQKKEFAACDHNYAQLSELIEGYKRAIGVEVPFQQEKPEEEREVIYRSMLLDSISQFQYQDLFEMIRASGSGLTKGRVIDFPLTRFMEHDEKGHYQDTPWMVILNLIVSVCYALVYALRSFAKNWRGTNEVPPPVREEASQLLRRKTPLQPFFRSKTSPDSPSAMQPVFAPDLVKRQLAMMNLNANDAREERPVPHVEPKHYRSPILHPAPSFSITASNQVSPMVLS